MMYYDSLALSAIKVSCKSAELRR